MRGNRRERGDKRATTERGPHSTRPAPRASPVGPAVVLRAPRARPGSPRRRGTRASPRGPLDAPQGRGSASRAGRGRAPAATAAGVRSLAHAAEQRAWGRDSDESLPRGHAPLRTGLRGRGRRGYRFRRRRWKVTVTSGRTDPLSTSEEANDKIVALEHPKLGRVTLPPEGVAAREPHAHVQ